MSKEDCLTAEELRARLYHNMKDKGLVDSLKSQLRNRLISELRQSGIHPEVFPVPIPLGTESNSLLLRASNSLVADHLERCGYEYCLSVFLPESSTHRDKLMTLSDLLQLLNISHQSRLYKTLITKCNTDRKQGFLWELLCEICALHGNSSHDSYCQTDPLKLPPPSSLEEQFRRVDEQYSKNEMHFGQQSFEERMLSYQKHIEERYKNDLKKELDRFKENELTKMRLEEREKCRTDFEQKKKELERTYQLKHDALVERERQNVERAHKQQEVMERDVYSRRQALLQEIDAVREREAALRRLEEASNRERQLMEEKWKSREELVKRREDHAKRLEYESEQRLKDEITKFKLEEQSRYLERSKNLEFREAKVKDDQRRLEEGLNEIQALRDELREKRMKLNETEAELIRIRHDLIGAEKHGEMMSEKVREMTDYKMVKEEYTVLKRELESCRMRISELTRDNLIERQKQEELLREMSDRASKPTAEVYMLQRQLDKAKEELMEERVMADHQRQLGQQRYQQELDRNKELLLKYEEQTLQMKEMGHELADLRMQLHGTSAALYNEIYHKPSVVRRRLESDEDLNNSAPRYDLRVDPLLICNVDDPALLFSAEVHVPPSVPPPVTKTHSPKVTFPKQTKLSSKSEVTTTSTDSEDPSLASEMLVQETKKRLKNLDREYEILSRTYRGVFNQGASESANQQLYTPPRHHSANMQNIHEPLEYQQQDVYMIPASDRPVQAWEHVSTPQSRQITPAQHVNSMRPHSSTPAGKNEDEVYVTQPARVTVQPMKPPMDSTLSTIDGTSPDFHHTGYPASPPLETQFHSTHITTTPSSRTQAQSLPGEVNNVPSRSTAVESNKRPITLSDLEARANSPSVLVLGDSASTASSKNSNKSSSLPPVTQSASDTSKVPSAGSVHPQPLSEQKDMNTRQEEAQPIITKMPEVRVSLDAAWKKKPMLSSDEEEKQKREKEEKQRREQEEEERRQREQEIRLAEEERKRRETEKRLQMQEAWEREQQELKKLESKREPSTSDSRTSGSTQKSSEEATEKKSDDAALESKTSEAKAEPEIDPILLKYMEKVQQKREQEKLQSAQMTQEKPAVKIIRDFEDDDNDEFEIFEGTREKNAEKSNKIADDDFW